jgi:drug/metabolite transporter (DMT)-like permease
LLQGLSPFQYLSYIGLFVVILNMFEVRKEKISLQFNRAQWITILGIGFSAWFFNLFMQFGYQGAPNPGYVSAINTSSIMTVTLLSSVFFKDHLSLQKIIGILGVIVGLVVILV